MTAQSIFIAKCGTFCYEIYCTVFLLLFLLKNNYNKFNVCIRHYFNIAK